MSLGNCAPFTERRGLGKHYHRFLSYNITYNRDRRPRANTVELFLKKPSEAQAPVPVLGAATPTGMGCSPRATRNAIRECAIDGDARRKLPSTAASKGAHDHPTRGYSEK